MTKTELQQLLQEALFNNANLLIQPYQTLKLFTIIIEQLYDVKTDLIDEIARATDYEGGLNSKLIWFENNEAVNAEKIVTEKSRAENAENAIRGGYTGSMTDLKDLINSNSIGQTYVDNTISTLRGGYTGTIKAIKDIVDQNVDAIAQEVIDRNEAIAQAILSTHTWLPAVAMKTDLPTVPNPTTQNYLCRVISDAGNTGVYEWIAGATAWTFFSDNQDFVDENELAAAINDHNSNNAAHSALFTFLNSSISGLTTKIGAVESKNRTQDSDIANEKSRAERVEALLDSRLDAVEEKNGAQDSAINGERFRAEGAEFGLLNRLADVELKNEKQDGSISDLEFSVAEVESYNRSQDTDIANEKSRAEGVEATLDGKISTEQTRAKNEEDSIRGTYTGSMNDLKDLIDNITPTTLAQEIFYADLRNKISASQLETGKKYLITDYQTIYKQPSTNLTMFCEVEPLVVTATSINTLSPIAFSPNHAKDIIYYDMDNNTTLYDWAVSTGKGVIYRRIDEWNNDLPYDFKAIKFRRYAIDYANIQTWIIGQSHNVGDIVQYNNNNTVYVCIKQHNGIGSIYAPTTANSIYWLPVLTNVAGSQKTYWSINNANFIFYIKNQVYNIPVNSSDYKDLYTFHSYTNDSDLSTTGKVYNNSVNPYISGIKKYLNNSVFATYNTSLIFHSNTVGNSFYNNTIGNNFYSNTIGNYFQYNTVGNSFYNNIVGDNFDNNTVGNSFYSNTVGNDSRQNTIGNSFYSNTIGNSFYNNTIRNDFYSNTVGNNFYSNTIGNNSRYNGIGNGFHSNTVGNDFRYNGIGNGFHSNTVGDDFHSNTIGNYFHNNTVGNVFNSNTIGNYFQYNNVGDNFYSNIVGNQFDNNTVGNDFKYNNVGNVFSNNTVGNGFQYNNVEENVKSTDFSGKAELHNKTYGHRILKGASKVIFTWYNSSSEIQKTVM